MICKICDSATEEIFKAEIRNKYTANYFYCNKCGFLQVADSFWLEEAYKNPINSSDTGILMRNIFFAKFSGLIIRFFFNARGKFLDYAGGFGIFTRLMRDLGFDFFWLDQYSENLLAKGFEYKNDIKIDFLTSFESFEHFVDPIVEIEKMFKISKNILFSTNLLPQPIPKPEEWWYYGLNHGQHVSFYSLETLDYIARKNGLFFNSFKNVHLFSEERISSWKFKACFILAYFNLNSIFLSGVKGKTMSDMQLVEKSLNEF